jgi:two-component system sensor kinase FixL
MTSWNGLRRASPFPAVIDIMATGHGVTRDSVARAWGPDRRARLRSGAPGARLWSAEAFSGHDGWAATVTETDARQLTLEGITRAAQVMAGQISLDGVATALLNAGLTVSEAPRGVVVLAASGAVKVDGERLAPDAADLVRAKPDMILTDLPAVLCLAAIQERAPQIRFAHDQPTAFPSAGVATVSALCTPVVTREGVAGFLYLEFDADADGLTPHRLASMTLLASQAAMTLDAIRAAASQREDARWRARSQMVGRVAAFQWNPTTRLSDGSPEYYAILGFDPADGPINFSRMTTLVHPADYPLAQATVNDAVRRRAPIRMEWRIQRPSGEIRNLLWTGQFDVSDPDQPVLQGIVMDLTDLNGADEALRVAQEDADRNLRLAWLGELAGSIVHEVNQPLGAIVASAEAAMRWLDRDTPDLGAARQSIARIRETAEAAGRTVASMKTLSAQVPMEPVERSLSALASEALEMSTPLITRGQVTLDLQFDPDYPIVRCEPGQILQVLLNLIRNAVDSLRELDERDRRLTVRTFARGDQVVIEIEDNGAGLTAETAERIFNPLFTTKADGMGLGLSICRRIVDAHDGAISVRSTPGRGATFIVALPSPPPG